MLKGKNIFISGGMGFIGSNLCKRLVKNNKLTIFDNGLRNALKFTDFKNHKNIKIIEGDILDFESVCEAMSDDVDIVVHMAAIAGVSNYYNYPVRTMEVNMVGTYHMLKAAAEKKLSRFVNFSSSEVYGPHIFRASETTNTVQGDAKVSRWIYSVSKLTGDHLILAYHRQMNLPVVSVRPFNIYGPGQVGEGAVQIFVNQAIKNKTITIRGDGTQIRAWCYIDDLINGVLLCMEKKEAIGNIFNIGNPSAALNIVQLANKIKKVSKSKSRIIFKKSKFADVELRIPSIHKAQSLLGYNPKVSLDEGLKRTISWCKKVRKLI